TINDPRPTLNVGSTLLPTGVTLAPGGTGGLARLAVGKPTPASLACSAASEGMKPEPSVSPTTVGSISGYAAKPISVDTSTRWRIRASPDLWAPFPSRSPT